MRRNIINTLFLMTLLAVSSCGDAADKYKEEIPDPEKPEKEYTADYDDGTSIYINVKIAVDKKGWNEKGEQYFKSKLAEQWKQINERFNSCGQKGNVKLARKYNFVPDLDDIYVYDGCSYWGENGADTKVISYMDKSIFKLCVIYDSYYQGAENGEYGGGCGNNDGIGTILVINASDGAKDKYNDHFDEYTYRAITHELGHFRGVIDLYAEVISAEANQVNHQDFMPISCLMNDMTYTPDEQSQWSDYAIKIINKAGNIKKANIIDEYIYDDFVDNIEITAQKGGSPVNATVKLYPQTGRYENGISANASYSFTLENGSVKKDARSIFFNSSENKWDRIAIFLVVAQYDGAKKYMWMADYMLHDAGMNGEKSYNVAFDF